MSRIESGADGINIVPLVKTYSRGQLRNILEDFRDVRFDIRHLMPNDFGDYDAWFLRPGLSARESMSAGTSWPVPSNSLPANQGVNTVANPSSRRINLSELEPVLSPEAQMLVKLQSAIALFTSSCLVSVAASPSSVGFVVTNGQAQVDGAIVRGNSTLFQGNVVQAGNVTSDLMFPGGSNLLLRPDSAVKVYREYAVLQRGGAIQRGAHTLVADGLKVSSLSPQGAVLVDVQDRSHLKVAAQGGAAEVRNSAGRLVARLEPGKALSFVVQVSPQDSTATPAAKFNPDNRGANHTATQGRN